MKKKTTVYLDEQLLRAAKVAAAREGKREYQIFEEALRARLGFELLERIWSRSTLSPEEAERLAVQEVRAARRRRRARR